MILCSKKRREDLLLVGDGFDVEAKGRTDDAGVLPINLQNDCSFSRIVQPTAEQPIQTIIIITIN